MKDIIITFLAGIGACSLLLLLGAFFISLVSKDEDDFYDPKG